MWQKSEHLPLACTYTTSDRLTTDPSGGGGMVRFAMNESMSSPSSRWIPSWRRAARVKLGPLLLLPPLPVDPLLIPAPPPPCGEKIESLEMVLVLRLLREVLSSVSLIPVTQTRKETEDMQKITETGQTLMCRTFSNSHSLHFSMLRSAHIICLRCLHCRTTIIQYYTSHRLCTTFLLLSEKVYSSLRREAIF